MRRATLVLALLAASFSAAPSPSRGGDATWSHIPYLPGASDAAPQVLVDDAARHRFLLIGSGEQGVAYPLVWARPKDGSSRWAPLQSVNTPTTGVSANVIFDPVRDRLVIWDGGSWRLLTANLTEPLVWSSREIANGPNVWDSAVAYDARHRRMLLFSGGGTGQAMTSEVYALSLDDDNSAWSALPTQGTPPTPRMNAVAIVDAANDRLILHGGRDFSYTTAQHIVRGDVWALSFSDSMQWTPLFTADDSSSQCYTYHSAVYDPVRERMLLFGGDTGDYFAPGHAEVRAFALDGSNSWSVAAAPDPVRGLGAEWNTTVYDAESDAVIEYDPDRYATDSYPTYRLALSPGPSWSVLEPHAAKPPWRFGQATAFDPLRNRWLSYGGRLTYDGYDIYTETYSDLWSFRIHDRPAWEVLAPAGGPPPKRQDARMLYDARGDRMILFGGQVTTGVDHTFPHRPGLGTPHFYGDTWALQLVGPLAWTPIGTDGAAPNPRDGHLMMLDSRRNRVLVFGGRDSLGGMNDLWALSLGVSPQWTQLFPAGTAPTPRWQAFGCYDPAADRVVIAGGVATSGAQLDAFSLSLADSVLTWAPLVTAGTPATMGSYPRPLVYDPIQRRILVFGDGSEASSWPMAAWELDLVGTPTWKALAASGVGPANAYGIGAAFDSTGNRVLLAGGTTGAKGTGTRAENWLLSFGGPYPLTGIALSSLVATAHSVALDWIWTPTASGIVARVERSDAGSSWHDIGAAVVAGHDHLIYTDGDIAPSVRYGYRLRTIQAGAELVTTESWVTAPGRLEFVLEPPRPNPSRAGALVSFDLPRPGSVSLSLFDVDGRRRELHTIQAAQPGRYSLGVGRGLAPGVYFVRLQAGSESRTGKLCVVR
jgi:hypothetical protein